MTKATNETAKLNFITDQGSTRAMVRWACRPADRRTLALGFGAGAGLGAGAGFAAPAGRGNACAGGTDPVARGGASRAMLRAEAEADADGVNDGRPADEGTGV